jgi:hypothetical protein
MVGDVEGGGVRLSGSPSTTLWASTLGLIRATNEATSLSMSDRPMSLAICFSWSGVGGVTGISSLPPVN